MSKEKDRLRRLVSRMRSADRLRPLKPCWSDEGDGSLVSISEISDSPSSRVFSGFNVVSLFGSSALLGCSFFSWPEDSAFSRRRPFSNSRSWPRKLKFGDIEGLRSLTNLVQEREELYYFHLHMDKVQTFRQKLRVQALPFTYLYVSQFSD